MQTRLLSRGALATLVCGASMLAPASPAEARFLRFGDRTLERGDHGRDVRVLQRWMTRVGVDTHVDGAFGKRTARSVRRYERRFDLRVDSRVSRAQARGLRSRAKTATTATTATTAAAVTVPPATLSPDGRTAIMPIGSPLPVQKAIAAANAIATLPYRYGGGHTEDFQDTAYDCSGAVSFVLHAAGLLKSPLDSTGLMGFGERGTGNWMSVYAHGGHVYIVIAGLRFDTSGRGEEGPRWRTERTTKRGYRVRHPAGL